MQYDQVVSREKKMRILLLSLVVASFAGALTFSLAFMRSTPFVYGSSLMERGFESSDADSEESGFGFLEIEPIKISLGGVAKGRQLIFEGYIEVNSENDEDVRKVMPRIMDSLNTYLRAIEYSDIDEPSSLIRLRLHMLRRSANRRWRRKGK